MIKDILLAIPILFTCSSMPVFQEPPAEKIQPDDSVDLRGKIIITYILYHTLKHIKKMDNG
jgi:hypothetical protein